MSFSSVNRNEKLKQMSSEIYDLVVIGGGITGAGIALDAVTRGMKVAVVEMQDFAGGTSSRSTKLVHGGLRYLKQFEVKMVAEVGKERAIVYENAPHVTTPEWMMLPIHKGGTFGKFSTSVGLRVYDYLAGVKRQERRKMLSVAEATKREPLVKKDGLKGAGYYVEYRTDDARLTLEIIKKAVEKGADFINYVKADRFTYDKKKVSGIEAVDQISGESYTILGRKVINAAGPWVDQVRNKDYSKNNKQLQLTKGVHLVIDQSVFPLKQALYFDTPDGRMMFAIPRDGKAYVGTTDTFYGNEKDTANPKMTEEDRQYILDSIRYMFPDVKVTEKEVESSWAGVRPLIFEEGKDPSEISRKDEIWEHDSGIITIAGGKLTGYRKMAEHVVDLAAKRLKEETKQSFDSCKTVKLTLSGADFGGSANFKTFIEQKGREAVQFGLTETEGKKLAAFYGSNADKLFTLAHAAKGMDLEAPMNPVLYAEVVYAIQEEMTVKPVDFFIRRTGRLFFDIHSVQREKEAVLKLMKKLLNWDEETYRAYQEELENEIHDAVIPVS
ncbi:glycerol-3-phosphate dehydrogenase/oxidase [Jeotgalibacillus sp. R-1-5s-1]|uniref:glycerol-3-phosphate dehydrogenase/oxidase n=1 Tax=Jeotgalibacillus sp. R-1-5s-1 TaxID=2555897 RepID=UPI00106B6FCE|nr:glycerol-3-phosphate dehydrogenase/oxidase [Jeotgalibacillus sp. R-1-5s-1]TFE03411.1 glycerol-3-phosphate dehydrogenase/oxidase [Jeotgalibacillus sp. R-1-5s-1]